MIFFLLAPFYEQAFVADDFAFKACNINIRNNDALLNEFLTKIIASIKVYRAD